MIATRGFVRIPQSSRARLSPFPTDAGVLRVEHRQTQLDLICILVCRDCRIPFSDCSPFDLKILLPTLRMSEPEFACSIVLGCAAWIAAEPKFLFVVCLPECAFCQYSVFRIHIAWAGASTMN
jgi:hypothetical protein